MRASEVIRGIRALVEKTTPQKMLLDINEIIREVVVLSASELAKNQVSLRPELSADLQSVIGDRVQLQQVLLNLILNGNEAISKSTWLPREVVAREVVRHLVGEDAHVVLARTREQHELLAEIVGGEVAENVLGHERAQLVGV